MSNINYISKINGNKLEINEDKLNIPKFYCKNCGSNNIIRIEIQHRSADIGATYETICFRCKEENDLFRDNEK